MDIIKYDGVLDKVMDVRGQKVILDSEVAVLYGVETKRVNEAVKNNTPKFPSGYIIELDKREWEEVKSKFSTSPPLLAVERSNYRQPLLKKDCTCWLQS